MHICLADSKQGLYVGSVYSADMSKYSHLRVHGPQPHPSLSYLQAQRQKHLKNNAWVSFASITKKAQ